jgi:large subunit ribosomal protein L9
MEIILLERIKNLGDLGDTVEVRSGYGRNYLLPKGKALPATEANRKIFEERKAELMKRSQASMSAARSRAEAIGGKTVTITALASEEGKLYGSVGPAEVAAAAAKLGLDVDKNEIIVPDGPIRQAGSYDVVVHLHPEVETSLSVVIERQNG